MNGYRFFIKQDFIFRGLTVCVLLLCAFLPFLKPEVFNIDLIHYYQSREGILAKSMFENILDNAFLYDLLFTLCKNFNTIYVVFGFQIFTIFVFYTVMNKLHPVLLLSLVLVLFFTIFSNQIRTVWSLIFSYYAYQYIRKDIKIFLLCAVLSVLSHTLGFFALSISLFIGVQQKTISLKALWILAGVLAGVFLSLLLFSTRLLYYFQFTSYISFAFVLPCIFFVMLRSVFSYGMRYFFLTFLILCILTSFQAMTSSRLVEILIFMMFIEATEQLQIKNNGTLQYLYSYSLYGILGVAILFFFYRFMTIYYCNQDSTKLIIFLLEKIRSLIVF